MPSKTSEAFFDDEDEHFEERPARRGNRGGYRRGRGRGEYRQDYRNDYRTDYRSDHRGDYRSDHRGDYRGEYRGSGRSRRGRGRFDKHSEGQQKGFRNSDSNYHLQEKFKDEFDFSKHELNRKMMANDEEEGKENKEDVVEEVKEVKEETEQAEQAEPKEEQEVEHVTTTAGNGFFDDFSNSNLTSENEEGRGERY